jgi:hypothetical protein
MIIWSRHYASKNFIRYRLQKYEETLEVSNGGLVMVFRTDSLGINKTSLIFLDAL